MRIVNTGMRLSERDTAIGECIAVCASALSSLEKQAQSTNSEAPADMIRSIDPDVMSAIAGAAGGCAVEKLSLLLYEMLSPATRKRAEEFSGKEAAGNS